MRKRENAAKEGGTMYGGGDDKMSFINAGVGFWFRNGGDKERGRRKRRGMTGDRIDLLLF